MKKNILVGVMIAVFSIILASCAPEPVEVIKEVEVVKEVEVEVIKEVEVEVEKEIGPLRKVRFTHGGSLCNLALFTSFEHSEWYAAEGLSPESVVSPSISEQIAAINAGIVDFTSAPYTSSLATISQSDGTVVIVSGLGVGGLGLVAQEGLDTPEELMGTKWGLSPSDTLEVLGYKYLAKNGMSYDDIEVIYGGGGYNTVAAWKGGGLDVTNCVEPVCSDLVDTFGGERLSDGTDIFGEGYSDCVLMTSTGLIENEPEVVEGVLKALMVSQQFVEQNQDAAIDITFGKWYKVAERSLVELALGSVYPQIDQRNQIDFIMNGVAFMKELGYITDNNASLVDSPDKVFDWDPMLNVIDENPELYDSLEAKSE